MSVLPAPGLPEAFPPYQAFREHFDFVPAIFRAQSLLPRLIEAEAQIAGAVLLTPGALTRIQKELILLALASHHRNRYCVTAHRHFLTRLGVEVAQLDAVGRDYHDAGLTAPDVAVLDFAVALGSDASAFDGTRVATLRRHSLTDEHILEVVLMTALTNFLCTLSTGLDVTPDFVVSAPAGPAVSMAATAAESDVAMRGPYLRAPSRSADEFPPFAFFQERFGFVPNIFRAQTLRPDIVAAEAFTVGAVLLTDDVLSRVQKEFILLAISAANLNTYCVAVHCEMLRGLGLPADVTDQIAVDHHGADLSAADKALLDEALSIARRTGRPNVERLRTHGFSDPQVLEAVVMASLTNFLNTLQVGLGTVPDFHPRREFVKDLNPSSNQAHPMDEDGVDPDEAWVAAAKRGDTAAFGTLVRRHHRRVYRLLLCVTKNAADAEDAAQTAFLKAFRKLGDFAGQARFGTWLTRIAINEGLECVRTRRPTEMLSPDDDAEAFRPRLLLAWAADPEQLYQREELRALVEEAVTALPVKYRLAIVLRDLEQLTTAEAAAALGLSVPTLKTHVLRGRLLLREALAPHFVPRSGVTARV